MASHSREPGEPSGPLPPAYTPPTVDGAGAQLLQVREAGASRRILRIGRDPSCEVVLTDPTVSSLHAELRVDAEGGSIADRGSRNGTWIGHERVSEARVRAGEIIRFGECEQLFDGRTLRTPGLAAPTVAWSVAKDDVLTAIVIGRDLTADLVLDEPTVSRRHASVLGAGSTFRVRDLDSANGTFVNGSRISDAQLRVGDVVQIGPFRLLFDGHQLGLVDASPQGFRVDAVDVWVHAGDAPLLRGATISIRPNELVALVGGSGAGKSTLLKTLGGILRQSRGDVLLNGEPLAASLDVYRPMIGFVPQADILHRTLPVEKALDYAARLRLPSDTSSADRRARVEEVLHAVDMYEHRKKLISQLSGGQAKRVSIALELLPNPRVLLLDEPTSGLDPGLDKRLMQLFRRLADEGRTVIVVTHSTVNLGVCDRVCFLAPGGFVGYDGPPDEATSWFSAEDYADIYTELDRDPEGYAERFAGQRGATSVATKPASRPSPPGRPALRQFRILLSRNVQVTLRDSRNLLLLLLQAPLIGLLLLLVAEAGAWSDLSVSAFSVQQITFALANVAVWFGLINGAREITKERPILQRELMAGLRLGPYLLAKLVPLVTLVVVQCGVLLALTVVRTGLPPTGTFMPPFLELLLTLALTGIAGVTAALLVSASVENEDRATTLVPFLLVPQFLLGGVAFYLSGVASWLSYLTFTSWSTRAAGSAVDICAHPYGPAGTTCSAALGVDYGGSNLVLLAWCVLVGASVLLLLLAGLRLRRLVPGR